MDKGIKMQKERAMGFKEADREGVGSGGVKRQMLKKGGAVKGCACGGQVKKGKK